MIKTKPNVVKVTVKLKTGETLKDITLPEGTGFSYLALTEKTLLTFHNAAKTRSYFVQGNNVAYIEAVR